MILTNNGYDKNMGRIDMQQVAANRKGPVTWCFTVLVFGPAGNLSYYRHSRESVELALGNAYVHASVYVCPPQFAF